MTVKKYSVSVDDPIAIGFKEPVGSLSAFVGWVNRVDDFGIGVELVDWFTGEPKGEVRIVSWDMVHAILTTDGVNEHGAEKFWSETAPTFQTQHNEYINRKFNVDVDRNREIQTEVKQQALSN